MGQIDVLTANFTHAELEQYLALIEPLQNIPLLLTTKEIKIVSDNIKKIVATLKANGYEYIQSPKKDFIYAFRSIDVGSPIIKIDFSITVALIAKMLDDEVTVIVLFCKNGSRIMAYKLSYINFTFLREQ